MNIKLVLAAAAALAAFPVSAAQAQVVVRFGAPPPPRVYVAPPVVTVRPHYHQAPAPYVVTRPRRYYRHAPVYVAPAVVATPAPSYGARRHRGHYHY